jgi:predicted outer membrane repeat protein
MRTALSAILVIALLPVCAAFGRNWTVNSSGTGDAPTIQAGIDSASAGDTVTVASGTYYEHDIQVKSGILFKHINSLTENCIIDAQGQGRVLVFDGVDATTEVKYMTFRGGHAAGSGVDGCGGGLFFTNYSAPTIYLCDYESHIADNRGGAIYCEDYSAPSFVWGVVRWNQAAGGGGGVACASYADPTFQSLQFTGNSTAGNGGAVHCSDNSTPLFTGCNIFNCKAQGFGGGIYTETSSATTIQRCNVVFNMEGEGVYAADDLSVPTLYCSDIYSNEGGDWIGRIASLNGVDGNFSLDPLFCDTTDVLPDQSMHVEACSPCLFGSHPYGYFCGAQIGYVYTGCECGEATEPTAWGTIKALYR